MARNASKPQQNTSARRSQTTGCDTEVSETVQPSACAVEVGEKEDIRGGGMLFPTLVD